MDSTYMFISWFGLMICLRIPNELQYVCAHCACWVPALLYSEQYVLTVFVFVYVCDSIEESSVWQY